MGGFGSGLNARLSDEEKKRRGTFRPDQSAEARDRKLAEKVLAFPTLREIPEPGVPLTGVGLTKYNELARKLFDAGRLNDVTRMECEIIGSLYANMYARVEAGKPVPTVMTASISRSLTKLGLVDAGKPIGRPQAQNARARRVGFASRNT